VGKEVKIILKSHIPEDEIEALAKCFLPDILHFFESKEGRQEFEQWKREQAKPLEETIRSKSRIVSSSGSQMLFYKRLY